MEPKEIYGMTDGQMKRRKLAIDLTQTILELEMKAFAYGSDMTEDNKNAMLEAELKADKLVNKLKDA